MSDIRIANRYAKALAATIGEGDKDHLKYQESLENIKALFMQKEAESFLKSPVMPMQVKRELLSYCLEKSDSPEKLKAFISIVADQGRVHLLPVIIDYFNRICDVKNNVIKGTVQAVVPLEQNDKDGLCEVLSSKLNKKIEISFVEDKTLLGGFVLKIGNYLFDNSLKTRIEALASQANY